MFTKYILCILTIEWAVIGTWLLKGKGKSYERIQKNDKIHEKDRFIRFQGMNLLYDFLHYKPAADQSQVIKRLKL